MVDQTDLYVKIMYIMCIYIYIHIHIRITREIEKTESWDFCFRPHKELLGPVNPGSQVESHERRVNLKGLSQALKEDREEDMEDYRGPGFWSVKKDGDDIHPLPFDKTPSSCHVVAPSKIWLGFNLKKKQRKTKTIQNFLPIIMEGSANWLYLESKCYWRDLIFTSMFTGGRMHLVCVWVPYSKVNSMPPFSRRQKSVPEKSRRHQKGHRVTAYCGDGWEARCLDTGRELQTGQESHEIPPIKRWFQSMFCFKHVEILGFCPIGNTMIYIHPPFAGFKTCFVCFTSWFVWEFLLKMFHTGGGQKRRSWGH